MQRPYHNPDTRHPLLLNPFLPSRTHTQPPPLVLVGHALSALRQSVTRDRDLYEKVVHMRVVVLWCCGMMRLMLCYYDVDVVVLWYYEVDVVLL